MKKQYRLLFIAVLLFYGFIATIVSIGLWDYGHSGACSLSTTVSRHCVTTSLQTVVSLDSKEIGGGASDVEVLNGIIVPNIQKGGTTTLWLGDEAKSIRKGDQVQLKSWNGCYFAIIYNGNELRDNYWEPELLSFMMPLLMLAILLHLWDFAKNSILGMSSKKPFVRGASFMTHSLLCLVLVLSAFGICELITAFVF